MELGSSGAGGGLVNRLFDASLEIGGAFATKQLGLEPTLQQQRLGLNQQITTTPAASGSLWNEQTALILGGVVFVVFFVVMASK